MDPQGIRAFRGQGPWLLHNLPLVLKLLSSLKSFISNISINKFHQEQKFFIWALGCGLMVSHAITYSLFQQGLSMLICEVAGSQI